MVAFIICLICVPTMIIIANWSSIKKMYLKLKENDMEILNVKKILTHLMIGFVGVILVISLIWGISAGVSIYSVWAKMKEGQAELAQAEANRQIKIYEAKAIEESAKHLAQAEIERAKGVAEANKIIGDSLTGNESYLRYLWISSLSSDKTKEVIYVPTEANLPILEAGKRKGGME